MTDAATTPTLLPSHEGPGAAWHPRVCTRTRTISGIAGVCGHFLGVCVGTMGADSPPGRADGTRSYRAGEQALGGPLTSPTSHEEVPYGSGHYTPFPVPPPISREASTPDARRSPSAVGRALHPMSTTAHSNLEPHTEKEVMNRVWGKAFGIAGLILMLGGAPSWGEPGQWEQQHLPRQQQRDGDGSEHHTPRGRPDPDLHRRH